MRSTPRIEVSCCCFVFRVSVMVRLQRRLRDLGEPEQPHELEHFRDLGRLDELQVNTNHASDSVGAAVPISVPVAIGNSRRQRGVLGGAGRGGA